MHLAAFAIDVDRVRDEVETEAIDPLWPFGFEVFLTESWLIEELNLETHALLLAETCSGVMKQSTEEDGQIFGAQLPFAVYDGFARGVLPEDLRRLFGSWKSEPRELVRDLAELWADAEGARKRLAASSLEVPLEPPIAPPTKVKLEHWA